MMDYQMDMCCLCLKHQTMVYCHLSDYYAKIDSALPKLLPKSDCDDYLLCLECCNTIDLLYEFCNKCIKNLNIFLDYKRQSSSSNKPCEQNDKLTDIEHVLIDNKESDILPKIDTILYSNDKHEDSDDSQRSNQLIYEEDSVNNTSIRDEPDIKTEVVGVKIEEADIDTVSSNKVNDIIPNQSAPSCGNQQFGSTFGTRDSMSSDETYNEETNELTWTEENEEVLNDIDDNTDDIDIKINALDIKIEEPDVDSSYLKVDVSDTLVRNEPVNNHLENPRLKIRIGWCEICDRGFKTSKDLRRHIRTHTGEKPFKCDVCKKRFALKGNLTTHKRIHTDERPYECDICDRGFKKADNLKSHKFIHTGKKPYKCDVCNRKFNRKQHLKRYKFIHIKPYNCDECYRTFNRKQHLRKHILNHLKKRNNLTFGEKN